MQTTGFTFGVEEEYQLIDARTCALRSRAADVLEDDWTADLQPELHQNVLEVGTAICSNEAELRAHLRQLRMEAAAVAGVQELDIMAAGLHPFSRWEAQEPTAAARPAMLLERFRRLVRDKHIFGLHIHVAVPEPFDRVEVVDRVRPFLPHLLALSSSSRFFEGEDTGYASFRTIISRRMPFAGVPPHFASHGEYRAFVDYLLSTDAIADERTLYWTIRVSPRYPTVEIRAPDATPSLDDVVTIAVLARALVVRAANTDPTERRFSPFSHSLDDVLLSTNEWRVARYGLDAKLLDPMAAEGAVPAHLAIRRLVERLRPVAEALGDGAALEHVDTLLARGAASDRLRELHRQGASVQAIADWLSTETLLGLGLDRRHSQRA